MLIARWHIDVRFGHKPTVIDGLQHWAREIAPQAGLATAKRHLLSGSVGALEATVEHDWEVADLRELDRVWTKLTTIEAYRQWGMGLEPHVVSGTAKRKVSCPPTNAAARARELRRVNSGARADRAESPPGRVLPAGGRRHRPAGGDGHRPEQASPSALATAVAHLLPA